MIRVLGLITLVVLSVRFLSDRIITVDVNGGADVLRDIGGYVMQSSNPADRRISVPYDPNTGKVGLNSPR